MLTTTITVCYRGKALELADIIIDTGSSHTIFSPDALETIGVTYENGDPVYEAYGIGGTVPFYTKVLDYVYLDAFRAEKVEIDVGMLPKSHKGLLGLDILKEHGFIVDLDKLELYRA
ncbi:putative aspartyl protease [Paenibacillus forsythiae]|uniref:Aspartyl protease n=1 Tax=Paenibacillus forsythiae TaxID=365616 RepID=A0ABU3HBW7_9BACL|nr:retropepsin-like aspartic protease [Paenibacillus forsythiae]MDT3428323.1 putative aspartyl protease [Paenibacillus forsythiae]